MKWNEKKGKKETKEVIPFNLSSKTIKKANLLLNKIDNKKFCKVLVPLSKYGLCTVLAPVPCSVTCVAARGHMIQYLAYSAI